MVLGRRKRWVAEWIAVREVVNVEMEIEAEAGGERSV